MQETWVRSLGWEDLLEKGKATHSSILAWRIPWIWINENSSSELNSPILVHFSLQIPKMSVFTLAISYLTTSNFTMIHGPNISGFYAILLFTALDFTSITSHIHNWVLFLLWICLFILSAVISPLFSSSILGTYQPGELIFQCHIFFPFHTVHGVLSHVWLFVTSWTMQPMEFSRPEYWSG